MSIKQYSSFSTKNTPQSEKIPGRNDQVKNNAGGYVFQVNDWQLLDRFLILGTDAPTYYVGQKELFKKAADCVIRCIKEDGIRVVKRIVEISDQGRAPKNDPAIFALAMSTSSQFADKETRKFAFESLDKVCRIGTHLFHFCAFREQFGGWGRGMRKAIANWYTSKEPNKLAYQIIKYQQRDGFSHRDLLRLSHPEHRPLFNYIVKGEDAIRNVRNNGDPLVFNRSFDTFLKELCPPIIHTFEQAKKAKSDKEIIGYIKQGLPREAIPTEFLTKPKVWEALLEKMPMTAMIRNLATMTKIGLIAPMSDASNLVIDRLHDVERLSKARIHPIQILIALKTYQQGRGIRGKGEWTPVPQVIDALDDAFYLCFKNVEPTNKRILIGLDVSGSMGGNYVSGIPNLSAREASVAMCMLTAKTENKWGIMAFTDKFIKLTISPKQRLDDILRMTANLNFGRTDCALPMLYAIKNNIKVDCFIIYTDNETWYGNIHPVQALKQYRQKMGIDAKLIVNGMVCNNVSIADPKDNGMMDVVGFDSAAPLIMSNFMRG